VNDRARDGHSSILIAASNSTDATKLWLQRAVRVQPNTTYSVRVEFALCCVSYEASALNPFQYIADASATSPRDSLPPFTFFPCARLMTAALPGQRRCQRRAGATNDSTSQRAPVSMGAYT
jgi:hypothetical protein